MRAVDLIRKKRDGGRLDGDEIAWLVDGLSTGAVKPYQWSALLMAIVWRGMDERETVDLTRAMMDSGTVVDLAEIDRPKIDKHSTGGVGDKTSLILAPIAAACGVAVPMVSGRGLGHTGGTLDKLESIPGFDVHLNLDRYREVLDECGLVLIGQTAEIAPADKTLYALRDATATVESIPLITASILSKKLAEGIDGLVLDVKTGHGAFMERLDDARALAAMMCAIGRDMGKRVEALVTRMDQPLGRAVGNAIEVVECIECLRGEGPADLVDLSVELSAEMLLLGGHASTIEEGRDQARRAIADGSALERLRRVVIAQGGDVAAIDDPERLPRARHRVDVRAPSDGFVHAVEARTIGHATMLLGAGRTHAEGTVNHAVGIILHRKLGDPVVAGEPLCTILADELDAAFEVSRQQAAQAYRIDDEPIEPPAIIIERVAS